MENRISFRTHTDGVVVAFSETDGQTSVLGFISRDLKKEIRFTPWCAMPQLNSIEFGAISDEIKKHENPEVIKTDILLNLSLSEISVLKLAALFRITQIERGLQSGEWQDKAGGRWTIQNLQHFLDKTENI